MVLTARWRNSSSTFSFSGHNYQPQGRSLNYQEGPVVSKKNGQGIVATVELRCQHPSFMGATMIRRRTLRRLGRLGPAFGDGRVNMYVSFFILLATLCAMLCKGFRAS